MSSESDFSDIDEVQLSPRKETTTTSSDTPASSSNEMMMEKIEYLTRMVESLKENLHTKENDTGGRKRKRVQKIDVSLDCAEVTRRVYTALKEREGFEEFDLKARSSSPQNVRVIQQVWDEVKARNGDKFNQEMVFAALKRYHKSLVDDNRRREKGTVAKHRLNAKRRNTRVAKQKRLVALEKIDWPQQRLDRVKPVIEDLEYISSDEEGDAERKEKKTVVLLWESEKLQKYKTVLDNYFLKKLCTLKQFRMMYKQIKDSTCKKSTRLPPENAISWTVKKESGDSLDDSTLDS